MNTPDISSMVRGILVVIGLAVVVGEYPRLEHWARAQAIESMQWKQGLPLFFGKQ
jgi:hypothetical protein